MQWLNGKGERKEDRPDYEPWEGEYEAIATDSLPPGTDRTGRSEEDEEIEPEHRRRQNEWKRGNRLDNAPKG